MSRLIKSCCTSVQARAMRAMFHRAFNAQFVSKSCRRADVPSSCPCAWSNVGAVQSRLHGASCLHCAGIVHRASCCTVPCIRHRPCTICACISAIVSSCHRAIVPPAGISRAMHASCLLHRACIVPASCNRADICAIVHYIMLAGSHAITCAVSSSIHSARP